MPALEETFIHAGKNTWLGQEIFGEESTEQAIDFLFSFLTSSLFDYRLSFYFLATIEFFALIPLHRDQPLACSFNSNFSKH